MWRCRQRNAAKSEILIVNFMRNNLVISLKEIIKKTGKYAQIRGTPIAALAAYQGGTKHVVKFHIRTNTNASYHLSWSYIQFL